MPKNKLSGRYIPISPFTQIRFILISCSFIILLVYAFHKNFYSLEEWPINNSKIIPGSDLGSFDVRIHDVIEPEISKEMMMFEIIVTVTSPFELDDKKLFDEIIVHKGKIIDKKKLYESTQDKKYEYAWNLTVKQNQRFDFHLFPLDDHTIDITFEIPKKLFNNTPFKTDFSFHHPLEFNGWDCVLAQSGIQENDRYQTFCYIYALGLNKTGHRIAFAVLLPLFILFFISLFTLSLEPSDGLKTIISLILALNAFRVVLENISPKTSYPLFSDFIYLLFLGISFLILLIHLLELEMNEKGVFVFVVTVHCFVISIFIYKLSPWLLIMAKRIFI